MSAVNFNNDMVKMTKIERILHPTRRFKERSYKTSRETRLPILKAIVSKDVIPSDTTSAGASGSATPDLSSLPSGESTKEVKVVMLGDSMIERMTTTGMPKFGPVTSLPSIGDWPPTTLMDRTALWTVLPPAKAKRIPNVLNLGVGGDRIQNVTYRTIGQKAPTNSGSAMTATNGPTSNSRPSDTAAPAVTAHEGSPEKTVGPPRPNAKSPLEGYLCYFMQMKSVRLWVIHAGSNNLRNGVGLVQEDLDALYNLLGCLLMIPSNAKEEAKSRILVTGLFPRTDIDGQKVAEANENFKAIVTDLNNNVGPIKGRATKRGVAPDLERVVFLPPSASIGGKNRFFADHVHLNLAGYQEWMKELVPKVAGLLHECPE